MKGFSGNCPACGRTMEIVEYHCPECDTVFEQRRPFGQADDPLSCPGCESPEVKRLLSRVMISVNRGNGSASAGSSRCGACARSSCAGCV